MYLLCKTLCENAVADATDSDLFVVFISNEKKQASHVSLINILFHCNLLCLILFSIEIISPSYWFTTFDRFFFEVVVLFEYARLVIRVCVSVYVVMSIIDMLIRCSCRFHYGIKRLVAELMGLYCGIIMSSVSRLIS